MLKNIAESFKNPTSIIDWALCFAVVVAIIGGEPSGLTHQRLNYG